MTAVLQHPESQATAKTTSARQDDFAGTTAKARSRLGAAGEVRASTPVPIKTIRLKGPGGIDCPARPASTPAVHVKAQQAQARSSSRTGRRAQANQGPTGQPSPRQSPHAGPATSGLCGPGSEAICTSSPVQRSTAIGYDEQGLGQGLHQQGDPPTQIPPARFGLGQGEGQAQPSPSGNTSSAQQSPTVSSATLPFAGRPAGFGHARTHALGHAHTHTRSQSYSGSTDFSSLFFAQTHPQQLYQYQEQFRDQLQDQYQVGNPNAQFDPDFQPQHHFGRPTEAPAPATGHQHPSSSPPPPHPPPPQPHRRRLQPTTSRRQTLSHCRSRRLAPRQRLDPPASHRRQSPFLPPPPHPPPPSSLAAASDLSSSLPPSPSPSPAPTSSSSGVFSASSSSHRHTLSSPSPLSVSCLPHTHSPPTTTAMSRSSRNPPPTGAGATRQNEYFVPRDGIDREVISADICRYLGNDALVRPGHYENPQTGQVVQGYYITAYRNLTTAMIEDLKADSARWDSERRAQTSRNTPGGIHASRDASGVPARHSSNSPLVQYRYSETHQSRQHHGPTESPYQTDPYRDAGYDGGPRYPGTGAPGYTGAAGSSYSQQGYASTSSGAYGGYPPPQQSPPPTDPRYASTTPQGGSTLNQAFQPPQDPYMAMGTNRNQRGYAGDGFANTASSAATTGASQPGYPAAATSPYPYSSQVPPSGAQSYGAMQPQDPFYGRAGQSTQQAFAAQGQQQQYDETPRTRTSATPTNTQTNPSGSSSRRSDRESDRHSTDRHHRSSRR